MIYYETLCNIQLIKIEVVATSMAETSITQKNWVPYTHIQSKNFPVQHMKCLKIKMIQAPQTDCIYISSLCNNAISNWDYWVFNTKVAVTMHWNGWEKNV
jgi:hypothetical protein